MPFKFGGPKLYDTEPFVYGNVWEQAKTTGPDRLVIAPSSGHVELLKKLADVLPEPFAVLYVLLMPRTSKDNEMGRYQSPYPLSRAELYAFLAEFAAFFEGDARHHVWVMSWPEHAQVIYDNHNVLYAYGPLETFKQIVTAEGLTEGEVRYPNPHSHYYNPEFDDAERAVMAYWDWRISPLAEQDIP